MLKTFYTKKYVLIPAIFIGYFILLGHCFASTNVILNVEGCNNNNICETPGENNGNCPNDCNTCNNNGVCEVLKGESVDLCPSDCKNIVEPTTTGGTAVTPVIVSGDILNLVIKTGINYAVISWDTKVPTYGSVSWGAGDTYDDGIINTLKITSHHEVSVENLSASTTYSFFVNSSLPEYYYAGKVGTFTTLAPPEIKIVPSIYNLTATSSETEIILNWNNPESADFKGVKIVRSPFFYPIDPSEGKVVYDGNGTYTRDSDLIFDKQYYYSAFSYDKDNNFSSASVVDGIVVTKPTETLSTSTQEYASTSESISTSSSEHYSFQNNFVFSEDDLELAVSSGTVRVYPYKNIKIIADASRFASGTKTLILRVSNPTILSKTSSYGFNLDSTGKYFYAIIPSTEEIGVYPFKIISYDLNNKPISIFSGFLDIKGIEAEQTSMFSNYVWIFYLIILISFAYLVYWFLKKEER